MYVCMSVCLYVFVCVYVCLLLCMYVYSGSLRLLCGFREESEIRQDQTQSNQSPPHSHDSHSTSCRRSCRNTVRQLSPHREALTHPHTHTLTHLHTLTLTHSPHLLLRENETLPEGGEDDDDEELLAVSGSRIPKKRKAASPIASPATLDSMAVPSQFDQPVGDQLFGTAEDLLPEPEDFLPEEEGTGRGDGTEGDGRRQEETGGDGRRQEETGGDRVTVDETGLESLTLQVPPVPETPAEEISLEPQSEEEGELEE